MSSAAVRLAAYDRWMSTLVGHAAVQELLAPRRTVSHKLIGVRYNRVRRLPLMQCVEQTRAVAQTIAEKDYVKATELRGSSFTEMTKTFRAMAEALPSVTPPVRPRRIACCMAAGWRGDEYGRPRRSAPGSGSRPYHAGSARQLSRVDRWPDRGTQLGDVEGWTALAALKLGSSRQFPTTEQLYPVARALETHSVDGLLVIGGWKAYQGIYRIHGERSAIPPSRFR